MDIISLRGQEILPYLDFSAKLRIEIFKEWPYFYEGDFNSERNYLQMYAKSTSSIITLVKDGDQVVGMAMGLSADESMHEVQDVFSENKTPIKGCYYFADAILKKEYRKKKIGIKMILSFEEEVRSLKEYQEIYACEVIRDQNDVRRPQSYKSLDPFWDGLDYRIIPLWQTYFNWLDIADHKVTPHLMRFRKKTLLSR